MPPPEDLSKRGRLSSLIQVTDQLLSKDPQIRFQCLYFLSTKNDHCQENCNDFWSAHKRLFNKATKILYGQEENVSEEQFIHVLRTIFCDDHDLMKQKQSEYQAYFKLLWQDSSQDIRTGVLDAFRAAHQKSFSLISQPTTPQRPPPNIGTQSAEPAEGKYTRKNKSAPWPSSNSTARSKSAQGKLERANPRSFFGSPSNRSTDILTPKIQEDVESGSYDMTTALPLRSHNNKQGRQSTKLGVLDDKYTFKHNDYVTNDTKVHRRADPNDDESSSEETYFQTPSKASGAREAGQTPGFICNSLSPNCGETRPLTPQPIKGDCTFQQFRPGTLATSISEILKSRIGEGKGFIYVFKAPKFFKTFPPAQERGETWVKIGVTTDIKKRIQNLKSLCGFTDLDECYGSGVESVPMDLLRRIEKVCHMELHNFRRSMNCESRNGSKCKSTHNEWFAVHERVAVRTVERWKRFLELKPYRDDGLLYDKWYRKINEGSYLLIDDEDDLDDEKSDQRYQSWLESCSPKRAR